MHSTNWSYCSFKREQNNSPLLLSNSKKVKKKKKNSAGIGLYTKFNYYHLFLVHTVKGNQIYDYEFHLKDQFLFVYGCNTYSRTCL